MDNNNPHRDMSKKRTMPVLTTVDTRLANAQEGNAFVFEGLFAPSSQLAGDDSDPIFLAKKFFNYTKQLSKEDLIFSHAGGLYVASCEDAPHGQFHDPTASMNDVGYHPPVSGIPMGFWVDDEGNFWIRWVGVYQDAMRWAKREATHLSLADFCEYHKEGNVMKEKRTLSHIALLPSKVPPEWSECIVTNVYPLTPSHCDKAILAKFLGLKLLMPPESRPPPTRLPTDPHKKGGIHNIEKGGTGSQARTICAAHSHARSNQALCSSTDTQTQHTMSDTVAPVPAPATEAAADIAPVVVETTSAEVSAPPADATTTDNSTAPSSGTTESSNVNTGLSEGVNNANAALPSAQDSDGNTSEVSSILTEALPTETSALEANCVKLQEIRQKVDIADIAPDDPDYTTVLEAKTELDAKIKVYEEAIKSAKEQAQKALEEKATADAAATAATTTAAAASAESASEPLTEVDSEFLGDLLEVFSKSQGANKIMNACGVEPLDGDEPTGVATAMVSAAARSSSSKSSKQKVHETLKYFSATLDRATNAHFESISLKKKQLAEQERAYKAQKERKIHAIETARSLIAGNKRRVSQRDDVGEDAEAMKRRRIDEMVRTMY